MIALAKLIRLFRRLRREEDGSEAIEFALIFPGFLLILVGAIEFAVVTFIGAILESAMADASRFGITGGAPSGMTREEYVLQIVADRTYGLVDLDKAKLETLVYPSFGDIGKPEPFIDENDNDAYDLGEDFTDVNGNGQWDPDMGAVGLGGPGEVVLYRITYTWGMLTPVLEPIIGSITQSASTAVRNEPY
ncbi:MAG TPA: TadE/TadG family type IV pilus assembly protein [Alphaproteobacteria bacterium]|jgi:Flp pilus assembly pilin Flp